MKNKHYDEWEFEKILNVMESNPLTANMKLEAYLNKYPKDYYAIIMYIATLITIGKFTEAETLLNELESTYNKDKDFINKYPKKYQKKIKANIISSRIRLLAYQEKYEEVKNLYLKYEEDLQESGIEMERVLFYCRKKLNLPVRIDPKSYRYIYRQMNEYSELDFLGHIKKHLASYNNNKQQSIFNYDFPLDKVLIEIKKYIPGEKRLYPFIYADLYIFKYDSCGIESGKVANYFKVVCFHNTSDIITMYPINCSEELLYIDLNYLIQNDTKQKGLSRIDRFNRRYQRKDSNTN